MADWDPKHRSSDKPHSQHYSESMYDDDAGNRRGGGGGGGGSSSRGRGGDRGRGFQGRRDYNSREYGRRDGGYAHNDRGDRGDRDRGHRPRSRSPGFRRDGGELRVFLCHSMITFTFPNHFLNTLYSTPDRPIPLARDRFRDDRSRQPYEDPEAQGQGQGQRGETFRDDWELERQRHRMERGRDRERDRERERRRQEESDEDKKGKDKDGKEDGEDMETGEGTDELAMMQQMFGFGGFDTTKVSDSLLIFYQFYSRF